MNCTNLIDWESPIYWWQTLSTHGKIPFSVWLWIVVIRSEPISFLSYQIIEDKPDVSISWDLLNYWTSPIVNAVNPIKGQFVYPKNLSDGSTSVNNHLSVLYIFPPTKNICCLKHKRNILLVLSSQVRERERDVREYIQSDAAKLNLD